MNDGYITQAQSLTRDLHVLAGSGELLTGLYGGDGHDVDNVLRLVKKHSALAGQRAEYLLRSREERRESER